MSDSDSSFQIIDSDNDNDDDNRIDELRQLAITSMIKIEKMEICKSPFSNFNDDQNDTINDELERKNLEKEAELKKKLLSVFNERKRKEIEIQKVKMAKEILVDSDDSDDQFEIITQPQRIGVGSGAQSRTVIVRDTDYVALIANTKHSLIELDNSIKSISDSIQSQIVRFKKLAASIAELKREKMAIHKQINLSRGKIANLNKTHKRKTQELSSLERDYAIRLSKRESWKIDCNRIICPDWLEESCSNANCLYQHIPVDTTAPSPKKSRRQRQTIGATSFPRREIGGLLSRFHCSACAAIASAPTLHLIDDHHCKSCCQRLVSLSSTVDIVRQLVAIWHHIFKRRLVSSREDDSALDRHLSKCSDALLALLVAPRSSDQIDQDLFGLAARHVIACLVETRSIDRLIEFLSAVKYRPNLVLFAVNDIHQSIPVTRMHRLLVDSIDYLLPIVKGIDFRDFQSILERYYRLSIDLEKQVFPQLIEWLAKCISSNGNNSLLVCLMGFILEHVFGFTPTHLSDGLSLSMFDRFEEQYWIDRKDELRTIALTICGYDKNSVELITRLDLSFPSWIDASIDLTTTQLIILSGFYSGDKDGSLELCERYCPRDHSFRVLFSRLTSSSSSPVGLETTADLFERILSKTEWLLKHRLFKACKSLLDSVPVKAGENCYQSLLGMDGCPTVLAVSPAVRQSSAIWLCYIRWTVITYDGEAKARLERLLGSDGALLDCLSVEHWVRVVTALLTEIGDSHIFIVLRAAARLPSPLSFTQFCDIIRVVTDRAFRQKQRQPQQDLLEVWLAIIDHCISCQYSQASFDWLILTAATSLSRDFSTETDINNKSTTAEGSGASDITKRCEVLRHITACYPVRLGQTWVECARLMRQSGHPIHQVAECCRFAVARFPGCRELWREYFRCANLAGDTRLEQTVKREATLAGIDLTTDS